MISLQPLLALCTAQFVVVSVADQPALRLVVLMDGKVQKSLQREAALMAAGWLLHPCRKSFAIALAMALVRPFMRPRGIH